MSCSVRGNADRGNADRLLLTVEEAAEQLNVTVRNVREHIYRHRLPIVKVGRLVRIEQSELEAFIERGRVTWD